MPRKGVIVYARTPDWFRGKMDSLYKERKTLCRANFCYLPLELYIAGSVNMAARQNSRKNRSGKKLRKNMAYFEQFRGLRHKHAFILDRIALIYSSATKLGRLQIRGIRKLFTAVRTRERNSDQETTSQIS